MLKKIAIISIINLITLYSFGKNAILDQVVWIVGDEVILQSEIENEIVRLQYEKEELPDNPHCFIAEQLALQKLFIAQAKIDSVTISESTINQQINTRIAQFTEALGTRENVEAYFKKSIPKIREELRKMLQEQLLVQEMQQKILKNITTTPAEVREFFKSIPKDSLPIIPEQVELQIITLTPKPSNSEIERVKDKLHEFRERIEKGDIQFSTLAILYSEDRGSALQGGEIGFRTRSMLVPEYANVAFSLNDPKKVSRIVETDFGYHIIQFIDKREEQVNSRHILLRPQITIQEKIEVQKKLEKIAEEIRNETIKFDFAVSETSDNTISKDRNGKMINPASGGTRFQYAELPEEIAKQASNLRVGEVSNPFTILTENNKETVAIIKLTRKIPEHKASFEEDYQDLRNVYTNIKKAKVLQEWIQNKIKETYNFIAPEYKNCVFAYPNWTPTLPAKD